MDDVSVAGAGHPDRSLPPGVSPNTTATTSLCVHISVRSCLLIRVTRGQDLMCHQLGSMVSFQSVTTVCITRAQRDPDVSFYLPSVSSVSHTPPLEKYLSAAHSILSQLLYCIFSIICIMDDAYKKTPLARSLEQTEQAHEHAAVFLRFTDKYKSQIVPSPEALL